MYIAIRAPETTETIKEQVEFLRRLNEGVYAEHKVLVSIDGRPTLLIKASEKDVEQRPLLPSFSSVSGRGHW